MDRLDFDQVEIYDLDGKRTDFRYLMPEAPNGRLLALCLRHLACLPCQEHIRAVMPIREELAAQGVGVVVVSFAEPERLRPYQDIHDWPVPVLGDPRRTVYHAVGMERLPLWRLFSPATLKKYWHLIRSGYKLRRAQGDDIFQGGGDFLLLRDGSLPWVYASHDPADRPSLEEIRRVVSQTA